MTALISSAAPLEAISALGKVCEVFPLPPDSALPPPVACHPDMLVSLVGKTAIISAAYADSCHALCEVFDNSGYTVALSDAPRGSRYPCDAGLNCAVGERFIICRASSIDPAVLDTARKIGLEVIDVKQGYAGCSCIVCDDTVITSDEGIHRKVTASGGESLFVPNDGIALPGYDVGFIGGCGGFTRGSLYFIGEIDRHPCGEIIRDFAARRGYDIVTLSRGVLTDCGGIKFL